MCLAPSPGTWVRPPGITAAQLLAVIAAFWKHSLHSASEEAAVICVFLYLPDPAALHGCRLPRDLSCSEHLSHKWSLDRTGFAICDHLWVVLFIILWFGFFPSVCVFSRMVLLVLTKAIIQLEIWQLNQRSVSVISREQRFHSVPVKMVFVRMMGMSDFDHSLLCNSWLNERPLRMNRNKYYYLTRLFWLNCGFSFDSDDFVIISEMLVGRDLLNSCPPFLPLTPLLPLLKVQGSGIKITKRRCHSSLGHPRQKGWDCVSL